MSNTIFKKKQIILHCANWAFEDLYSNLLEAAKEEGFESNEPLMDFISRLDQDVYGRGCIYIDVMELDENNRRNLKFLTDKAIEKIKQKGEVADQYMGPFLDLLEKFKDNII